jgi:hypothetical protein
MASTAYDSGSTDETASRTSGSAERGTNRPHSSTCGSTRAGMNCTAWNSVSAKADTSSPSAVPSTAFSTDTTVSVHTAPSTCMSSTPTVSPTASTDCTSATAPKASA